jgi:GxxExxY protein
VGVFDPVPPRFNRIAKQVSKAAESVFDNLGPGLLEGAYRTCLRLELDNQGLAYRDEVSVPVAYQGTIVNSAMRFDFLVEESVIVVVKAVDELRPVHEAQLRTYLKFSKLRVGLLVNFDVVKIKDGIKRIVL